MSLAGKEFGKIDFLLHSIAFANTDDLAKPTIETSRDGFKLAMEISAYSLLALCNGAKSIMASGCSVLAMTYYGGEKVVPGYNVMGICKAALDACVKYAAFDLGPAGVRVNAIYAGAIANISRPGRGIRWNGRSLFAHVAAGAKHHARRSWPHRGIFDVGSVGGHHW